MKKRLRKKLHYGEFIQRGYNLFVRYREGHHPFAKDRDPGHVDTDEDMENKINFIIDFSEWAYERGMELGGGFGQDSSIYMSPSGDKDASDEEVKAFLAEMRSRPEIEHVFLGSSHDCWHTSWKALDKLEEQDRASYKTFLQSLQQAKSS